MNYLDGVQKFGDYIENNLEDEIDIDDAIATTYISKFHFYRLFKAIVGLSVYDYVKKRKLTKSVESILETKEDIITISTKYGFSSQEVFTRNFKKMFGITPGQLRKKPHIKIKYLVKPIRTDSIFLQIKAFNGQIHVDEKIEKLSVKLIGISRYSHDDNVETIAPFIEGFLQQVDQIPKRKRDVLYRVCFDVDSSKEIASFQELVAVEVTDFTQVPKGMIAKKISNIKVVTYIHKGRLFQDQEERVLNTYHFIYNYRIPLLNEKLTNELVIERYGPDFNGPHDDDSKMHISFSII